MCLFNAEHLKNKVAEAVAVLEADDDAATEPVPTVLAVPIAPPTPAPTAPTSTAPIATNGNGDASSSNPPMPQTPDLSSKGPSAVTSPSSSIPNLPLETVYTLSNLARLPASEIVKLASSPNATGLPLPKADPEVTKATDDFIDALTGQTEGQKKQVVGQKL